MKKTLFLSAILGAALCSSAMGSDATITYYDAYAIAPGDGSVITFSGDTKGDVTLAATNNKDYIITTLKAAEATALLEDGGKRFMIRSDAAVADAGTLIIAAGKYNNTDTTSTPDHAYTAGQLFVDASGGSDVTMRLKNDLVLGTSAYTESSWGNNYGGAMRLSSDRNKRIELSGAVTLVDNAQIAVGGQFNTITGAVNGAGKTLTLTLNGKLNFTGSTTLGTLSSNNNTLLFGSAGTTTSIGTLTGTVKGLTTEATTTIGSGLSLSGTLTNGGALSVNGDIAVDTTADIAYFTVKGINASTADSQSGIASTASADYYAIRNVGTLNLNGYNVTGTGVTQSGTDYVFSKDLAANSTYVVYGAAGSKGKNDLNATNLLMTSGSSLSISTGGNNTAFVRGIVDIRSGATLTLTHTDALSWATANPTQLILLTGEDAAHKATLALTATQTLSTNLELRGHSVVTGSTFNTYEGNITATGTDNTISSNINLRRHMDVMVLGTDSTLTLSGAIGYHNDTTADKGVQLTKLGSGTLTISGNITTGGVIAGAGSTIITSQTISGSHTNDPDKNQTLTLREVTMGRNSTQTLTGNVVLDGVTLTNELDVCSGGSLTLTGGATTTQTSGFAMVVGKTNHTGTLTFDAGTYDLSKPDKGIAIYSGSSMTVKDGATLKVKTICYSSFYSDKNGNVTVEEGGALNITNGGSYVNSLTSNGAVTVNGDINAEDFLKSNAASGYTQTAGTATMKKYLGLDASAGVTLSDTGKMVVEGTATDTGNGIWMGAKSTITMGSNSTLEVKPVGLTFKNGTITNTSTTNERQVGTNYNQDSYRGDITISADTTVNSGQAVVSGYTFSGGSVTVKSGTETTIKSALSATTALTVNNGSTATFSGDASVASVAGAGSLNLSHNLTVTGNTATIGSLTLSNGAAITVNNHNGSLTTSALTVNGANSAVNANLFVSDGGTMSFASGAILTMGCGVTIGDNVTVVIDESIIEGIANRGETVAIITDAEAITSLDNKHFTFVSLNSDGTYKDLSYANLRLEDAGNGTIVVAPEPATATLSLLALAALAARRKRH